MGIFVKRGINPKVAEELKRQKLQLEAEFTKRMHELDSKMDSSGKTETNEEDERDLEALERTIKYYEGLKSWLKSLDEWVDNINNSLETVQKKTEELEPFLERLGRRLTE